MFSYRQTIKAYPSAGGAYIVTKDNLGLLPAQVAGVALLTDYVLTVAVSVSAGTAALYSGVPGTYACRVPIALGFIALIAWGNLRGVKESGRLFAAPTYVFIVHGDAHRSCVGHRPVGDRPPRPRWRRPIPPAARRRTGSVGIFLHPARLRLRRRRDDRRRGHLQRCARLQAARVAQRPQHADGDGHVARRDVPRPVVAGASRCTSCPPTRRRSSPRSPEACSAARRHPVLRRPDRPRC